MAADQIIRFPLSGGGKPSFEEVYERYYSDVLRFLNRHMSNYEEAEDLASEVFLYCYQNYDRFDPERSAVSTWLFLVVKSRLKTYYRDRKEHLDLSDFEDWLLSSDQDMERAVYLEQLRAALAQKIQLLPEKQQQVIVMRYFQGREYEDIARCLCTTAGNVRVMLSRSLTRLKTLFANSELDWSV